MGWMWGSKGPEEPRRDRNTQMTPHSGPRQPILDQFLKVCFPHHLTCMCLGEWRLGRVMVMRKEYVNEYTYHFFLCIYSPVCGNQRTTSDVLLHPPWFLRQSLTDLELTKDVRLSSQATPGIHLSLYPRTGIVSLYRYSQFGGSNSGPQACMATTLPSDLPSQPKLCLL